jgi:ADP-ribosylglycohydrolase
MSTNKDVQLQRALCSLEGLSVGDAFGEGYFVSPLLPVEKLIAERVLIEEPPWDFTDDTNMALSIVESLRLHGKIEQAALSASFVQHFDLLRGYGPAMIDLLLDIQEGADWQLSAAQLFGGSGSFGNGGAMRVVPLGAYFADDLEQVVVQARLSAEVTHTHPEGVAGAIAVAVGAAVAWQVRQTHSLETPPTSQEFLDYILPYVPDSKIHDTIQLARNLSPGLSLLRAVLTLGNGSKITAQDTVAFALWCASQHLNNYEEALWLTVSGLGDRDTNCAIVGGIVAMYAGIESIPTTWRANREALPTWPFE